MSISFSAEAVVPVSEKEPDKFLIKLAALFNKTYYDHLTAIASKSGKSAGMVELADGNYRETSYEGELNGVQSENARAVKKFAAKIWNGDRVTSDEIQAFRDAAHALRGENVVETTYTPDMEVIGQPEKIELEELYFSAEAFADSVETLQSIQKPKPLKAPGSLHAG